MKRLIKKIGEQIKKLRTKSKKKTQEKTWDERKKELLAGVRNEKPGASKTTRSSAKTENKTVENKKQEVKKVSPGTGEIHGKRPQQSRPANQQQNKPLNVQRNKPVSQQQNKPRTQHPGKPVTVQEVKPDLWNPSAFQVEPVEGKVRFQDFDLPVPLMHAIFDLNFKYCTPIQAAILSKTLAGKDASGKAQTGTGKTAAFLITIISKFLKNPLKEKKLKTPRALILAPTRELVMQIANDARALSKYTKLNVLTIVGGIDYQKQKDQLTSHVIDVVVATPGRLLDFYSKRTIDLRGVEILVIDEADRMLDMGFIPDMRKIIRATPRKEERQTLLFSATLPAEVLRLASSWTTDAEFVDIEPTQVEGKNVEQITYIVTTDQKYALLYNTLVQKKLNKVLVFTNRRDEAKTLMDLLYTHGINTAVLSGDVDQRKRMKTLADFKAGNIDVLVATDVAGRGIHIEGISHVINFNLPEDPEDYVHRIGRTGRAGAEGISISFASEDDSFQIPAIEKYLGHKLITSYPDEELLQAPPAPKREAPKQNNAQPRQHSGDRKRNYNPNYRRKK